MNVKEVIDKDFDQLLEYLGKNMNTFLTMAIHVDGLLITYSEN